MITDHLLLAIHSKQLQEIVEKTILVKCIVINKRYLQPSLSFHCFWGDFRDYETLGRRLDQISQFVERVSQIKVLRSGSV